ncbi:MAG: hypothetical protein GEV09_23315 [Pseudonocardiaceae bacterium]|nr:hypothetical protein [Pseudonocardiaceae bacterium]
MTGTVKPTRGQRLLSAAREAAELRAYRTHPDVAALAIERVRSRVDALVWTGLVLGLLFTMSNVATFAARGAEAWSLPWLIAWLLDPMVSLCLVGTLIAEATLARYQLRAGAWVRGAKWGLLAATYTMNTWSAWASGDAALIVLHSVPPAVVFVMAEAITDLRDRLTDAVLAAHRYATHHTHRLDPDEWPTVRADPATTRAVTAADRVAAPAAPTHGDHDRDDAVAAPPAQDHGESTPPAPEDRSTGTGTAPTQNADRTDSAADRSAESGPDVSDLVVPGRAVRYQLAAQGQALSRRALIAGLRDAGHAVSTARASALLHALNAETPHTPNTGTSSGAQRASEAA